MTVDIEPHEAAAPAASSADTSLVPLARALPTVATAAGGFLVGVAMMTLLHRRRGAGRVRIGRGRRRGRIKRRGSGPGSVGELVQIVGSRSLLVDVHLLGGRD